MSVKSGDNFVELVISFYLYVVPGIKLRLSGLYGKSFYLLCHLASPGIIFNLLKARSAKVDLNG